MLRRHGVTHAEDYDEANKRRHDGCEGMGRRREKDVNGVISPHGVLEGGSAWKEFGRSIDEWREEKERDLKALLVGTEERLLMQEWIGM